MYQSFDELFDELDMLDWLNQSDEFEGEDLDFALGKPTAINTTDIESQIAEHMRQQRPSIQEVHMHSIHPVGIEPLQGIKPGDINVQFPGRSDPTTSSQPDVSFVGTDRKRVNLEVDARDDRSLAHQEAHLQAMQKAAQHAKNGEMGGMTPHDVVDKTRSVFVETDSKGRVTQIRKVAYKIDERGRVTEDKSRSETINLHDNPRNLREVLNSRELERPAQGARQSRPQRLDRGQRSVQGQSRQHPLTQRQRSPQARSAQRQRSTQVRSQQPQSAQRQRPTQMRSQPSRSTQARSQPSRLTQRQRLTQGRSQQPRLAQRQRLAQGRLQPSHSTQARSQRPQPAQARLQQRRPGRPGQRPAQTQFQPRCPGRPGNRFDAFEELFSVF